MAQPKHNGVYYTSRIFFKDGTASEQWDAPHPMLDGYAEVIHDDWGEKISPYAAPYIDALSYLKTLDNDFGADSAKTVIAYLLSNLRTWRGETARRVKAELNEIFKYGYLTQKHKETITDTYWEKK